IAIRSIPIPKANPLYCLLSILQLSSTAGSTIPQPKISTQPAPLHILQPPPLQKGQEISISALISVNGKKEGRKRICVSSPNISFEKYKSVCFRSVNDTFLSMYKPST